MYLLFLMIGMFMLLFVACSLLLVACCLLLVACCLLLVACCCCCCCCCCYLFCAPSQSLGLYTNPFCGARSHKGWNFQKRLAGNIIYTETQRHHVNFFGCSWFFWGVFEVNLHIAGPPSKSRLKVVNCKIDRLGMLDYEGCEWKVCARNPESFTYTVQ